MRRVDQILSSYGYCSRRESDRFLKTGRVALADGTILKQGKAKADPRAVRVDGEPIEFIDGMLILLHKPLGLVCSHDPKEGPNIYSLLPGLWMQRNPQPASIGRLDKDTSGAILVTDDGQLIHRWTSPKHKVEKVYEVTVERPFEADLTEDFASGTLQLDSEPKPCEPARYEQTGECTARLTLVEGKYHQVRRMFAALGYHVEALHRSRFGDYDIEGLAPGEWRAVPLPEGFGLKE